MDRRKETIEPDNAQDENELPRPGKFNHNELVKGWLFAWVCRSCGITTLEDRLAPNIYYCWFCHFLEKRGGKFKL